MWEKHRSQNESSTLLTNTLLHPDFNCLRYLLPGPSQIEAIYSPQTSQHEVRCWVQYAPNTALSKNAEVYDAQLLLLVHYPVFINNFGNWFSKSLYSKSHHDIEEKVFFPCQIQKWGKQWRKTLSHTKELWSWFSSHTVLSNILGTTFENLPHQILKILCLHLLLIYLYE